MNGPRGARAHERRQQKVRRPVGCAFVGIIASIVMIVTGGVQASAQDARPSPGPVELVLVIDTSASMFGEPLDAAARAGRTCVSGLPAGSSVAVIGYSTQPTVLHPLSAELVTVERSLTTLVAIGETATHDALIAASRQFPSSADATQATEAGHRYVILLTDGNDTASQRSAGDAIAATSNVEARLWIVAVETGDADLGSLDELAELAAAPLIRTGPEDLVQHCASIAGEIVEEQRRIAADRAAATDLVEIPLGSAAEADGVADDAATEFPLPPPNLAATSLAATSEQSAASARALWVGAGAVFFSMLTMFGLVLVPSHSAMVNRSINRRAERSVQDKAKRGGFLGRIADSTSVLVESTMNRRGIGTSMNESLDAAGINLRPSEFVAATGGLAILVSVIGAAIANPPVFIAGAIGVPLAARQFIKIRSAKRTKLFQEQLVETLMLMSGSVRAGHGLMQSIGSVAEQASEPTSTEFSRVITEVRIGRDPIHALQAMAERVDSIDLTWTVRAMALNRELGGNLAEILDNISNTIRERNKIADQVRALSAEGKFSAYVLFGLPFGVVFAVRILNPDYIEPLFNTTKGYTVIGVSLTLMTVGAIWIRKMIKIEY